ncbi:MAG: hypothetical protein KDD45_07705, partial [Bdellovibrionales bacterium]|nr:hypothetical protein [Bdellovibrionales bacterium]
MKTMNTFLNKNKANSGFTVLELIFSLIILIFSLLSIASISQMVATFSSKLNTKSKLADVRSEIVTQLSSRKVWINIVQNAGMNHPTLSGVKINDEMSCLKNFTACTSGTYNLTLLNINNKLITDPNVATEGFDLNGVACNSFGADNKCIFRYNLTWTPVCPASGPCIDPQVRVKIDVVNNSTDMSLRLNATPYEFYLDRPRPYAPVVKQTSFYTNSTYYFTIADQTLSFDPTPYIYSEDTTLFTISPPSSGLSTNGGSVTVSGGVINYRSPNNYHGFDSFQYKVTDQMTGKQTTASTWVWVMTPYTWLGNAGDNRTSVTKNFCGKVVNGTCDRATFPVNDKHYVFTKVCTECDVLLNNSAESVEMDQYFPGKVTLSANGITLGKQGSSSWQKYPIFLQSGGVFDGGTHDLTITVTNKAAGYVYTPTDWAYSLTGGQFLAPSLMKVVGPFNYSTPGNFVHQNGLVNLFQVWSTTGIVSAPGIHFHDLQIDNLTENIGSHHAFVVTDGFTVDNNLRLSVRGLENVMTYSGAVIPNINVKGNLIAEGTGGVFYNQLNVTLNGDADQQIIGVNQPVDSDGAPIPIGPNLNPGIHDLMPFMPKVKIDKSLGKVTLNNWVGLSGFEVIQTPAGGIDINNSTVVLGNFSGEIPFRPGTLHFQDLYMYPGRGVGMNADIKVYDPVIYVDKNLYHYTRGASHIYGDSTGYQVNLLGDLYIDGNFDHDHLSNGLTVNMLGTNDSTIHGTATSISQMHINIEKSDPAVKVNMVGGFGTTRDLKVSSGQLIVEPNLEIRVPSHGWNGMLSQFDVPGVQFHHLTIDHGFRALSDIKLDGNLNIGTHCVGGLYSLNLGGSGKIYLT